MKVVYSGNYREHASLMFKGVAFNKGKSSEVSEDWFNANLHPNISEEKAPVVKPKAKTVAKKAAKKGTVANANQD